jgi:hypothetical protein
MREKHSLNAENNLVWDDVDDDDEDEDDENDESCFI